MIRIFSLFFFRDERVATLVPEESKWPRRNEYLGSNRGNGPVLGTGRRVACAFGCAH